MIGGCQEVAVICQFVPKPGRIRPKGRNHHPGRVVPLWERKPRRVGDELIAIIPDLAFMRDDEIRLTENGCFGGASFYHY